MFSTEDTLYISEECAHESEGRDGRKLSSFALLHPFLTLLWESTTVEDGEEFGA